jgi:release factor glutamine methyltransferase
LPPPLSPPGAPNSLKTKTDEPWTVLKTIAWSREYLRGKGVSEPRLSSELLLGAVLDLDRLKLFLQFDRPLNPTELAAFKALLLRRARHEPMAYILARKEFWSLSFEVNPAVLIPRPETELLVEEALALVQSDPRLKTIVELGTGSGAVILSLAKTLLTATPVKPNLLAATERSREALKTAAANARRLGLRPVVSFLQGDWLGPFAPRKKIHLILSNPPYLSHEEIRNLDPGIKNFEPLPALDGGPDGLTAIREILGQARDTLQTGGWLLLEIGAAQGPPVLELARRSGFDPAMIRTDYAGKDRVLKARNP